MMETRRVAGLERAGSGQLSRHPCHHPEQQHHQHADGQDQYDGGKPKNNPHEHRDAPLHSRCRVTLGGRGTVSLGELLDREAQSLPRPVLFDLVVCEHSLSWRCSCHRRRAERAGIASSRSLRQRCRPASKSRSGTAGRRFGSMPSPSRTTRSAGCPTSNLPNATAAE